MSVISNRRKPVRRKPGRPATDTLDQYRQRLLHTALDVFLRNGFEGTSLNAVAKISGVSRDTLYRQYGSKEELFRAATGYGLARLAEHLRIAVAITGTVEEVLQRVAIEINNDMSAPGAVPVLRLIIAEAHRFPDVAHRMFQDSRVSLAPLVDYLETQRESGVLEFDDAFEAAFMLSTLAFGGVRIFLEMTPPSQKEKERWVKQVVSSLLGGWKKVVLAGDKRTRL
jgi:TetR/AcrR family transcriptional repressor of mexJK operon